MLKLNYTDTDNFTIGLDEDFVCDLVKFLEENEVDYFFHYLPVLNILDKVHSHVKHFMLPEDIDKILSSMDWLNLLPYDYKNFTSSNEFKTVVHSYFLPKLEAKSIEVSPKVGFIIPMEFEDIIVDFLNSSSIDFAEAINPYILNTIYKIKSIGYIDVDQEDLSNILEDINEVEDDYLVDIGIKLSKMEGKQSDNCLCILDYPESILASLTQVSN